MASVQTRSGTQLLYRLREGERCALLSDGRICVVHPDRPPFIKDTDGSETVINIAELDPKLLAANSLIVGEGEIVRQSFRLK